MRKSEPKFDYSYSPDELIVRCPECESPYLHQESADVYYREEDDNDGTHVSISGNAVGVDRDMEKNPSPRRQSLTIEFSCERCSARPSLRVVQHKGHTLLSFVWSEDLPQQ